MLGYLFMFQRNCFIVERNLWALPWSFLNVVAFYQTDKMRYNVDKGRSRLIPHTASKSPNHELKSIDTHLKKNQRLFKQVKTSCNKITFFAKKIRGLLPHSLKGTALLFSQRTVTARKRYPSITKLLHFTGIFTEWGSL